MRLRNGGNYTMEALALVSALFIAGIFVFSHYARQAGDYDQAARRLADEVPAAVQAFFQAQPDGVLSQQALLDGGLKPPPRVLISVPEGKTGASDWQVRVWHLDGAMVYLVGPGGVNEEYR